jgi:hypothetical protein
MENGARFDMATERLIRSRLGDDRMRIELEVGVPCFYTDPERTTPVKHVDLPFRVVGELAEGQTLHRISDVNVTPEMIQFLVNDRGPIRYDANGWHWA